jgi:hypothetical protein
VNAVSEALGSLAVLVTDLKASFEVSADEEVFVEMKKSAERLMKVEEIDEDEWDGLGKWLDLEAAA